MHTDDLEQLFHTLRDQWKEETKYLSSLSSILAHPAYQRIISIGPCMVPYIIDDLAREFDHWSYALHKLTGHVLPQKKQANADTVREAWLEWAAQNEGDFSHD